MKFQVTAKLDEQKYKSCEGMDPKLWPMLKDKVYVLNTWNSLKWAKWSAESHKKSTGSNLDLNTIQIVKVND